MPVSAGRFGMVLDVVNTGLPKSKGQGQLCHTVVVFCLCVCLPGGTTGLQPFLFFFCSKEKLQTKIVEFKEAEAIDEAVLEELANDENKRSQIARCQGTS